MPYGTPYNPADPESSRLKAVARVGPSDLGYMYRIEECTYSVVLDAEHEHYGSRTQIEIYAYPIKKKTPTGVRIWLSRPGNMTPTRFVSDNTTKQFAGKTIGFAMESFIARKERQAKIHEAKARLARQLIATVKQEFLI